MNNSESFLSSPVECIDEFYSESIVSNVNPINKQLNLSRSVADFGIDNIPEYYPLQQRNSKRGCFYEGIEVNSNKWIELACEIAFDSVKNEGGPFGAVLLQIDDETDKVIRYWKSSNKVTQLSDPTAHAEVIAIRSACSSLGVFNLGLIEKDESKLPQVGDSSHCEIYSSCEPCPMCYAAIHWAGIPNLYFAATRFDAEAPGLNFSDAEIYADLEKPYKSRKIKACQCSTSNSLDAFNLWKNIEKTEY